MLSNNALHESDELAKTNPFSRRLWRAIDPILRVRPSSVSLRYWATPAGLATPPSSHGYVTAFYQF